MTYRGPQAIGDVLSELMARRGYAGVQSAAGYEAAWREAAGPLAAEIHPRRRCLRRGTLEVVVANSTLVQELGFQKQALLKRSPRCCPTKASRTSASAWERLNTIRMMRESRHDASRIRCKTP